MIPGMTESGWTYADYEKQVNNENSNLNFYTQCRNLIDKIKTNKNSWPYLKPVDIKDVPDYYEKIKEPMDVETLEGNLEKGIYKTKDKFIKDLKKIFANAKEYNKPFTIYYKYAKDIETSIENEIKNLKDS